MENLEKLVKEFEDAAEANSWKGQGHPSDRQEIIEWYQRARKALLNYHNRLLLDLLAIIHRDGGHYTKKFGLKRSVAEAKRIASNWVVK